MIRSTLLLTAAAMALGACTPPTPRHSGSSHWGSDMKVIAKLDCPESQGDLKRSSAAADGRTCTYADDNGSEVTLQLVSLEGTDAAMALAPLETQLKAEMPPRTEKPEAAAATTEDKESVNIDLPGVHIHAHGNGKADVDAGNVNINANDKGAHINVRRLHGDDRDEDGDHAGGGVTVDADDSGAEIHIDGSQRKGTKLTYILASETPGPHGYRLAGYEARGPRGGPLAVASVKSKNDQRDDLYRDMRALVTRNIGG